MENPTDKRSRSRVSVDEDDRISNLPESIISHILSFLPTKNVVTTSILSTRWKFLWIKVTTLDFILYRDKEKEEEGVTVRKFMLFVNKVLSHIDSQRLLRFSLQWTLGNQQDPEYVSMWISYAISMSVRSLHIDLGFRNSVDIHLPGTLFTCATLQVLQFNVRFVLKVPSVVCLPKLEVLKLRRLSFESNECLPKLISGCPMLSTLKIGIGGRTTNMRDFRVSSPSLRRVIVLCVIDGSLEIDAPNLKFLVLAGVKECLVKRLDSVDQVVLHPDVFSYVDSDDDGVNGLYIGRCNSAVKLVEAMYRVKFLTLKNSVLKSLSYATTPLSVCFGRLIRLDVSVECCHWSSLGEILGRSTKLQVLKITKMGCSKKTDHKLCWNDPTKVPECLSSSLQHVSFVEFRGLEDEIEMIKYILQHGEVLKSFTLKSAADPGDLKIKYQLLQHMTTFPRFSRACQLQFD